MSVCAEPGVSFERISALNQTGSDHNDGLGSPSGRTRFILAGDDPQAPYFHSVYRAKEPSRLIQLSSLDGPRMPATAIYPRVARANSSIEGEHLGISSWGRSSLPWEPIRWISGIVLRRQYMRAKAPNVKSPSDSASVSHSSPDCFRGVGTRAPWPPATRRRAAAAPRFPQPDTTGDVDRRASRRHPETTEGVGRLHLHPDDPLRTLRRFRLTYKKTLHAGE